MTTLKDALLAKISAAKSELEVAEQELDQALREIRGAPRAEKTTVTGAVEDAFIRLRKAKADLVDLEEIIAKDASGAPGAS